MSTALPLVPLEQIKTTFVPEQTITSVEGTLASLFPVKTGTNNNGPWSMQDGVLKVGAVEMKVCFANENVIQDPKNRGKMVRLSSTVGPKGMNGVKLKDCSYFSVKLQKQIEEVKIWVTSAANIEYLGASTGQPVGQAQPAVQHPKPGDYRPSQAPEKHYEPEGEPMPTNEPMEDRMADFLKTLDLWCQFLGLEKEEVIKGWGPDKISEQVTGFMMSFKGKYATHARPTFKTPSSQAPENAAKQEALIERAAEATALGNAPLTWKDYIYKNKRLGDYPKEELDKMIKWAESSIASTPEAIILRKHLLMAKAERDAVDVDAEFHPDGGDMAEMDIPF